jgi:hypothetical protein
MIYKCNEMRTDRKCAIREVYTSEPAVLEYLPWLKQPISFDHSNHPLSIYHGRKTALILDPIIEGCHLNKVQMDGGSSLNLIYTDKLRKMGIDESRIELTHTWFKGIIPGMEASLLVKSLGTWCSALRTNTVLSH